MISDRKALGVRSEGNDCVITFEGDDAPPVGRAQLLLDAAGRLVGVDLGGGGFSRVAVMIGSHEDVDRTAPADVTVTAGAIRIRGGAKLIG